jgi:K+-sensing histidine kinase KdpD
MITHLYGLVAGYSTLIVGAVISYYFFVPPYDSWGIPDAYHLIYFSTKFVIGSLLVLLVIWVNDQMKEIFSHH